MDIMERLKKIDDFFKEMTVEEFERKLEAAGINEITPSSNVNIELLLSPGSNTYHNYELVYTNKDNGDDKEISFSFFSFLL